MRLTVPSPAAVLALALAVPASPSALPQGPTEEAVPVGTVKDGRMTLPTGGQFAAPDSTWEWRLFVVGESKTFVLAKIGESARIFVMHQPGAQVNDEFMRGFVDGTLRRSASQGITVREPSFVRGAFPVPGTYRFEAGTTLPNGATFTRAGYVLPSGHIVMTSFQGTAEPTALTTVTASFKATEAAAH